MKLNDKTILITGASSGIGQACALALAAQGARLILAARRLDRLQACAKECNALNSKTHCLSLDVTQRSNVAQAINDLPPKWQSIDVLINNAGLAAGLAGIAQGNIDDWERMIDTNVKGLLYVTRSVLPTMLERDQGHIVNIGSIAGHEVYPQGAVYCATKHAVNALNRGIKMDVLGSAIRVTSIDPGMVDTEFSLVRFAGDETRAQQVYQGMQPLNAEDIADAIVYALTRPSHINISEMLILPTDQASATQVHREKGS